MLKRSPLFSIWIAINIMLFVFSWVIVNAFLWFLSKKSDLVIYSDYIDSLFVKESSRVFKDKKT